MRKLNILVVDDREDERHSLVDALTHGGHKVIEAGSAAAAEDIISGTTRLDWVITDFNLEGRDGKNGLDVLTYLVRTRPACRGALTSRVLHHTTRDDAASLGFKGFHKADYKEFFLEVGIIEQPMREQSE